MLRSFCVGALVGFFFGSSKQGMHMRDMVDGFITSLLSNDEESSKGDKKNQGEKERTYGEHMFSNKKHNGNGKNGSNGNDRSSSTDRGRSASAVAERTEAKEQGTKSGETGVTIDKVQELADALNTKPVPPTTDEIQPS